MYFDQSRIAQYQNRCGAESTPIRIGMQRIGTELEADRRRVDLDRMPIERFHRFFRCGSEPTRVGTRSIQADLQLVSARVKLH